MATQLTTTRNKTPKFVVLMGIVVPVGVSAAAAVATYLAKFERVAVTAWISVAVIGTASVISAATALRKQKHT